MKNKNVRVALSISMNIIIVIVGAFIIYTAGTKAYTFGHSIFDEQAVDTPENARETDITIPDKVSAKELASIICGRGLAKDQSILYFQIVLSDYKDKFIGGTYTLNTSMTPTEMMEVLSTKSEPES